MAQRNIGDVVRRAPVTLPPAATVQQACQAMHENRIGAVMITDPNGHLEGIFTGRDVVRLLAEGKSPAHTRLEAVMTRSPACMPPTLTAIEALRLMQDGGFRHVPVVEAGKVVGLVSTVDFRALEHDRLDEETGVWERI